MALCAKNRVPAMDVLPIDYEYCTISCYAAESRNDLGEPIRTLTERATNVKCSIDPLNRIPSYVKQGGLRDILRQGMVERVVYIMILLADQTVESGDVVADCDGVVYDVLHVSDWRTHKEAFIRKAN